MPNKICFMKIKIPKAEVFRLLIRVDDLEANRMFNAAMTDQDLSQDYVELPAEVVRRLRIEARK